MYTGTTMKFDSFDTPLNDLISLLRSVGKEVTEPIREQLHEPGEFDDDKVVQYGKKKFKEAITPHIVIETR